MRKVEKRKNSFFFFFLISKELLSLLNGFFFPVPYEGVAHEGRQSLGSDSSLIRRKVQGPWCPGELPPSSGI